MYDQDGEIYDRREMLRVKVKSLAAEAKIIRCEERKSRGMLRYQLKNHRRTVVRKAARAAHLALGFIRGRSLEEMEPKRRPEPPWITAHRRAEVAKLVARYGPDGMELPDC